MIDFPPSWADKRSRDEARLMGIMKKTLKILAIGLVVVSGAGAAQAGCVTGAVVGGVAGHVAGHHTLIGAAAGCAVGHHMAVEKKKRRAAERVAQARDAQQQGQPAPPH